MEKKQTTKKNIRTNRSLRSAHNFRSHTHFYCSLYAATNARMHATNDLLYTTYKCSVYSSTFFLHIFFFIAVLFLCSPYFLKNTIYVAYTLLYYWFRIFFFTPFTLCIFACYFWYFVSSPSFSVEEQMSFLASSQQQSHATHDTSEMVLMRTKLVCGNAVDQRYEGKTTTTTTENINILFDFGMNE